VRLVLILIGVAIVGPAFATVFTTALVTAALPAVAVMLAATPIPDGVRHDIERLDRCGRVIARDDQLTRDRAFLGRLVADNDTQA
jgi:hypothetical protein